MRILLLSRNAALYSTSRLVLAGRARGHDVDVVDPLDLSIVVARGRPTLGYAGSRLPRYDVVIPRIGASITRYALSVLRELEENGAVLLNGAYAVAISRDKVRSLQLLARERIAVPRTVCMRNLAGLEATLDLVGGCPAIVKLPHGAQGIGTMLVESEGALLALLETLWAMGQEVVLQEYVRESDGRDVRAFVVGGRIVAAMRRTAAPGEFRSNLHRGAHAEKVELNRRYQKCALAAASALGLEIAGVDMLEGKNGPVVVEVNSSPGLEGIEAASTIDIATAVIGLAETRARKNGRRRISDRAQVW
jgi:ribosomal protein S6--L-glutamate ligase